MLHVKLTINGDTFEVSGEVPFTEMREFAKTWYTERVDVNVSAAVQSLKDSNDALAAAEAANPNT